MKHILKRHLNARMFTLITVLSNQALFVVSRIFDFTTQILMSLSVCLCSVFGISPIIQSNCSYTWKLIVHPDRKWYHFVNPIMLLILYYTLATLIRLWLQEPIDQLTVRTADRNAMKTHEGRPFIAAQWHCDITVK